jgi:phage terminase large subunit-like protein
VTPTWTTACHDWRDRIKEGRSLIPCGPLFPKEAEEGMKVFRSFKAVGVPHPEGGGVTPTVGDICGAWAQEIAEVIHGAYNSETGERLIREAFLKVPKKNWKSGLAAMIMLSLMTRNWRQSNEAAIIAPTKDGAENVFKPMRDAIRADPELDDLYHVEPVMRRVTHRITGMTCRVYAADSETVAGKIWAFVILEELWQLAKRKGAEDMLVEATGGQASRPEGIVISITTESDEDPIGIYKAKLEFAQKVRDGVIDAPYFLPILYEWPEDMLKDRAYMDPENFHLVNPNYGASVDPVDLNRKFAEAIDAGGEKLRVFLAKRLNVPTSENIGGSWAGAEFWAQCGDTSLTLDSLLERSEVAVVGIDGGGLDDLLGFVVMGRERDTRKLLLWAHAWAHEIVLERRKSIANILEELESAGQLTIVKKPGEDVKEVADLVMKVKKAGLLADKHSIGVDSVGIGSIVDELTMPSRGFSLEKDIIAISQGWRLNGAIKTLERAAAGRELVHSGERLMSWNVSNAKVVKAGNADTINKQVSGSTKIDALMAALNAVSLMCLNPAARKKKLVLMTVG